MIRNQQSASDAMLFCDGFEYDPEDCNDFSQYCPGPYNDAGPHVNLREIMGLPEMPNGEVGMELRTEQSIIKELLAPGPSSAGSIYQSAQAQAAPFSLNEGICFENYAGPFQFDVIPSVKGHEGNKIRYNFESRKLFCKMGTHEFNVVMDFDKIENPQDMILRAVIAFTDPEHLNTPVYKCLSCIGAEKTTNPETEDKFEHILRASKDDHSATYLKSPETGRCYVFVPLRKPELGSKKLIQNFNFSCLSSCKSTGIFRRPTSIIFTLLDATNSVLGRSVTSLRICSAPSRDYQTEYDKDHAKQLLLPTRGKKSPAQKTPPKKSPKKENKRVKEEPATASKVVLSEYAEARPKEELSMEKCSSQEQSSSQETVFTDGEEDSKVTLRLKTLMRDSKKVLKFKHSQYPHRKALAKHLFMTLTTAQSLCQLAHGESMELELGNN